MSAYSNAHGTAHGANHPSDGRQWVVLLTPDTRRMMSTPEVQAEVSAGTLSRETLVWRAGMTEWMAIGHIGELAVPFAREHRAPPAASWEPPMERSHQPAVHTPRRPQAQRRISNTEIMQELVTTGAVAAIVVAMTLYLLSLGGAFAPLTAAHGAAARSSSNLAATAQGSAKHQ